MRSAGGGTPWTEERAERQLRSLELFGMRFGLDRMRRLMTVLESPQQRFDTIHVLGTNGKTSTTRMAAAILQRHGQRTAAYTSPHLVSYRERVLIDGQELDPDAFAAAIARASWASERVNRTLSADDHVTQFELLTAAALWAMAAREVDVAVIEAGLGGRYDATSVVDSQVTVLTNVGLEHTRWLGPTLTDIAEEKLAVVAPGTPLVLGEGLAPAALTVAERVAAERDAQIVRPGSPPSPRALLARGAFQGQNFALARAAAGCYLQGRGIAVDERAVSEAAAHTSVQGRMQLVATDPPTLLDGAHNPDAVAALVASLPDALPARPLALVLGVLEDKDAASMLALLLPRCQRAWFTAPPSERALSPAALQSLSRQLGFHDSVCEPDADRALAQAQDWARSVAAGDRGEGRASVLATGSVYLVGHLLSGAAASGRIEVTRKGSRSAVR